MIYLDSKIAEQILNIPGRKQFDKDVSDILDAANSLGFQQRSSEETLALVMKDIIKRAEEKGKSVIMDEDLEHKIDNVSEKDKEIQNTIEVLSTAEEISYWLKKCRNKELLIKPSLLYEETDYETFLKKVKNHESYPKKNADIYVAADKEENKTCLDHLQIEKLHAWLEETRESLTNNGKSVEFLDRLNDLVKKNLKFDESKTHATKKEHAMLYRLQGFEQTLDFLNQIVGRLFSEGMTLHDDYKNNKARIDDGAREMGIYLETREDLRDIKAIATHKEIDDDTRVKSAGFKQFSSKDEIAYNAKFTLKNAAMANKLPAPVKAFLQALEKEISKMQIA